MAALLKAVRDGIDITWDIPMLGTPPALLWLRLLPPLAPS
jgi:hypothetical protein